LDIIREDKLSCWAKYGFDISSTAYLLYAVLDFYHLSKLLVLFL